MILKSFFIFSKCLTLSIKFLSQTKHKEMCFCKRHFVFGFLWPWFPSGLCLTNEWAVPERPHQVPSGSKDEGIFVWRRCLSHCDSVLLMSSGLYYFLGHLGFFVSQLLLLHLAWLYFGVILCIWSLWQKREKIW